MAVKPIHRIILPFRGAPHNIASLITAPRFHLSSCYNTLPWAHPILFSMGRRQPLLVSNVDIPSRSSKALFFFSLFPFKKEGKEYINALVQLLHDPSRPYDAILLAFSSF